MQVVILAAGRGMRMGKLTDDLPKPLLVVAGKTLLEHKFDILPNNVDEVILVVGYYGGKIQERFGGSYKDKRILYVEQEKIDGTAGALSRARSILRDSFLVLNGDDLYAKDDAVHCIAIDGWTMLVQETESVRSGNVTIDADGKVLDIEEGDHSGRVGLTNTGMYALDTRIFDYPMVPKSEGSEEYGLPQTILAASQVGHIPFSAVKATHWVQVTSPGDLEKAEEMLKNQ